MNFPFELACPRRNELRDYEPKVFYVSIACKNSLTLGVLTALRSNIVK